MPFSKSLVVRTKHEVAIGYKDLGEADDTALVQPVTDTPNQDPNQIVDPNQSPPPLLKTPAVDGATPIVNDGTPPVVDDGTVDSGTQANFLLMNQAKSKTKTGRSHIMMTCGGCARTIENTESWTDLLVQSGVQTKTKNIRYLYALRGPDDCSSFPEFNVPVVAKSIFDLLSQNTATQLVVIPHSSGGGTCGLVLTAIAALDTNKVLLNQVTLLSLDAGVHLEIVIKSKYPNFYHANGFIGYYAQDSIKPKVKSQLSDGATQIENAGGLKKQIEGANACGANGWCEHFAVFCTNPSKWDFDTLKIGTVCPDIQDPSTYVTSFINDIPFD